MTEKGEADDILNFENKKKKKPKPLPNEAKPVLDNGEAHELPDFGSKKKKKLKPVEFDGEHPPEPVEDVTDITSEFTTKKKKKVAIDEETIEELAERLDDDLSFTTKKKKKKSKALDVEAPEEVVTSETGADTLAKENVDASGFTYDMLLKRVFTQLGALNPELVSDQKRRLVMVPPQMARVGTKKTLFVNFSSICRSLNRDASHLATYMFAELGTQGSVDANGALLIRGRYQSKHIEPVLRTYCRNYVLCGTCQSPETDLCKDSRLLFLHCRRCGSRITVKNVTSGFQAVTGKRAALRAKTQ